MIRTSKPVTERDAAGVERHHHMDSAVRPERWSSSALQGVPRPGGGGGFRAMVGGTRRGFRIRRSASLRKAFLQAGRSAVARDHESHHAIMRREIGRHRGRKLDTAADGFFAASRALLAPCAALRQRARLCVRSASRSEPVCTPASARSSARNREASPSTSVPASRRWHASTACRPSWGGTSHPADPGWAADRRARNGRIRRDPALAGQPNR